MESFFPRAKSSIPWPPLDAVQTQNQYSFISCIWEIPDAGELVRRNHDGSWAFAEDLLDPALPVTLLVCVKLDPRPLQKLGIGADWQVAKHFVQRARARGLRVLPAGGVGWQELVFVVRGPSFAASREVVREIFETSSDAVLNGLPAGAGPYPLSARTVTYPCVSLATYLGDDDLHLDEREGFRAKALLNVRPGVRSPIDWSDESGGRRRIRGVGGDRFEITEQFGEYDLRIAFPEKSSLSDCLRIIRDLRASNGAAEYSGWSVNTATLFDFEPCPSQALIDLRVPYSAVREPLDLAAILGFVRRYQWPGVDDIHSERFISILRRVESYAMDPVLADSVAPLERYFSALAGQVEKSLGDLQNDLGDAGRELVAYVEPDDVEYVCSILEFALRQRAEGLQQFLFNALPSSFYGRGGLNRLLLGGDSVLQEVSGLFGAGNPGFVVFGMPSFDGFSSHGPIVTAPIPALFALEWWWVIYHEAAIYVQTHLFDFGGAPRPGSNRDGMNQKTFADLVTLRLPFGDDLDLLTRMYAERIATIPPQRAADRCRSAAERVGMLALIQQVIAEHGTEVPEDDMEAWAESCVDTLVARSWLQDAATRERVAGAAHLFLGTARKISSSHRQSCIPDWSAELARDVLWGVRGRAQAVKDLWTTAVAERFRAGEGSGNGGPHPDLEVIVTGLRKLLAPANPGARDEVTPGTVNSGAGAVSSLVHAALRRWAAVDRDRSRGRPKVLPDFYERMTEYLGVWHRAVTEAGANGDASNGEARRTLGPVILRKNLQRRAGSPGRSGPDLVLTFGTENFLGTNHMQTPLRTEWQPYFADDPELDLSRDGMTYATLSHSNAGTAPFTERPEETPPMYERFPSRDLTLEFAGREIQCKIHNASAPLPRTREQLLEDLTIVLQKELRGMFATIGRGAAALGVQEVSVLTDLGGFDPDIEFELLRRLPISAAADSTPRVLRALADELREEVSKGGLGGSWGHLERKGRRVWMEVSPRRPAQSLDEMMAASSIS